MKKVTAKKTAVVFTKTEKRALVLRKAGKSYQAIAKVLGLHPSGGSTWTLLHRLGAK
jgi:hypothetical protein